MEKSSEHDVKLFEAREDAPEAFEFAEEPFDFVAPLVELLVIFPRLLAIILGRHDSREASLRDGCARLIGLVSLVHGHGQVVRRMVVGGG
jgi:hypothetical protein